MIPEFGHLHFRFIDEYSLNVRAEGFNRCLRKMVEFEDPSWLANAIDWLVP